MKKLAILALTLTTIAASAQNNLERHVRTLASDEFAGRKGGTRGDTLAINYIIGELAKVPAIQFWGTDGQQRFNMSPKSLHSTPASGNIMTIDGQELRLDKDFFPPVFSAEGNYSMPVVFAGYGLNLKTPTITRNDYAAIDAQGRWVMILRESPDPRVDDYLASCWDFAKVEEARAQGAAGVLLVHGKGDRWQLLESTELWNPQSDLPVLCITRETANRILDGQATIEELEIASRRAAPANEIVSQARVSTNLKIDRRRFSTSNVIATVPGRDPKFKDEVVVVAGHFDHFGIRDYKGVPTLISGADDNASGAAAVLELARKVGENGGFDRSVMFILLAAEEEGLVGSKYFTHSLPLPRGEVVSMLNFDMIGRYAQCDSLEFYCLDTFKEGIDYARSLPNPNKLRVTMAAGKGFTSDHIPFLSYNIPSCGITTGVKANPQVHTPLDNVERIDFRGGEQIIDYAYDYLKKLCDKRSTITLK